MSSPKIITDHAYQSLGCVHNLHKECRLACPYCAVVCGCLCHEVDRDRITVSRSGGGLLDGDDRDSMAIWIGDLIPSDASGDDFFRRHGL